MITDLNNQSNIDYYRENKKKVLYIGKITSYPQLLPLYQHQLGNLKIYLNQYCRPRSQNKMFELLG